MKSIRIGNEGTRKRMLRSTLGTDTWRDTRRVMATCAVAMAAGAVGNPAHAQDVAANRPIEFGLMAGGVGVTGQFRGKMSSGVAGGATLQLPLSQRLALRADLLWLAIANAPRGCADFRGSCSSVSEIGSGGLGVVARLNPPEIHWSPYVVAGVAAYHLGSWVNPAATVHANPFGWQGGLGIEVRSSKRVFFAEMKYMTVAPGGVAPVLVGMRF